MTVFAKHCAKEGCNTWEMSDGPNSFLQVIWPGDDEVQYFCMGLHLLEWMESWGDRGGRFFKSFDLETTSMEEIIAALDEYDSPDVTKVIAEQDAFEEKFDTIESNEEWDQTGDGQT